MSLELIHAVHVHALLLLIATSSDVDNGGVCLCIF
jgi:hypothetical protein